MQWRAAWHGRGAGSGTRRGDWRTALQLDCPGFGSDANPDVNRPRNDRARPKPSRAPGGLLSPFEPPATLPPQLEGKRRHLGHRHHHLRRHGQRFRRQRAPPTRTARSSNMYPAGLPCCYRLRFHRYRPTERTAPHRTDRRTDRRAQGSTLAHQCPSPQCLGLISAWRIDAYQPPYFAPVGAPKQAGAPQGWTSRWATRASHAPNTYPAPRGHSLTPQASSFSFLRFFKPL